MKTNIETLQAVKQYKMSDNTARLIACLQQMQDIFIEVEQVLINMYGIDQANAVINETMAAAHEDTVREINHFISLSITDNILDMKRTAI